MAVSLSSYSTFLSTVLRTKFVSRKSQELKLRFSCRPVVLNASYNSTSSFSWDDVYGVISKPDDSTSHSSKLDGFFQRIKTCNRGFEMKSEFLPFIIEEQIAGYVHNQFASHLRKFQDVFAFPGDNLFGNGGGGGYVILNPSLKSPEDRTNAVGDVIKCLGGGVIPGIRNELYPVTTSYGVPAYFSLERAAAPFFGIKAYGIHLIGYVDRDGEKSLWIGKRSDMKPTFPGMLDHLAAGGLPHDITCKENVMKECQEEAGIPRSISNGAVSVGAVSYVDINGYSYKRDVLFCYDLKLPADFVPTNEDGEVESFKLIPVKDVANIIRRTEFFKANCCLVIIDFLFRHGYISPEDPGYLNLLQSLRSGDCS
ncbi:hypothetical protein MKX03_033144 [Papaver bracteatum]|nr:hypothetical protein MKX03_033144 [Papaver bracteatum]